MVYTLAKWPWEHAGKEFSLKYEFLTALDRTPRFVEQRRPLLSVAKRAQEATFIEEKLEQQKLLNALRNKIFSVIAVPVFSEAIHPTEDLIGQVTLDVAEDLTGFWNLSIAEVLLIKSVSQDLFELKEITQVNATNIVVSAAVEEDFQEADTIIYPCFIGILNSFSITGETAKVVTVKTEFKEVKLEWELPGV